MNQIPVQIGFQVVEVLLGNETIHGLHEAGRGYQVMVRRGRVKFLEVGVPVEGRSPRGRRALGREAAARRTTVMMADMLKENKKLEVELKGLKG